MFHDGVFEALDDCKKENLLAVIREHAASGLQQVITAIDSDLPARPVSAASIFEDHEISLRLHDEGDEGRLFKMSAWCVVTTTEAPPGMPVRTHRHAVEIQRVQVPSR